jgi:hypothetical protein
MTQNTKEIVKSDNFFAPVMEKTSWGEPPALSSNDIIIPKILLMQPSSDAVLAGQAVFGELRDSISNEILASPTKTLDIIPFSMKKAIIVSEYEPKTRKHLFKEILDATPENEALAWEEGPLKRARVTSFFCLLPDELEKGGAIPKLISIRGMSFDAAKVIATQMYAINSSATPWLPPPAFVMTLSVKIDKNDKGTFAVLHAKRGRKSTDEEIAAAHGWHTSINAGKAKVDEAHEEPVIAPVVASATAAAQKAMPQAKELKEPKGF